MPRVHFAKSAPMVLHDSSIGEMHTPSDGESMLQVEPQGSVIFDPQSGEAKLSLKNISKLPVVYKIQTTSPEKFRVRPRCGVVQPNEGAEVDIWLKPDHQLSGESKDKFLVMATHSPAGDCNAQEVAELWKEKLTTDPDVENHRLVCRLADSSKGGQAGKPGQESGREKGPLQFQEQADRLAAQLNFTRNLQYATLFLLMLLFAGFGFLMYQQMPNFGSHGSHGSCQKTTAYQCPKRK